MSKISKTFLLFFLMIFQYISPAEDILLNAKSAQWIFESEKGRLKEIRSNIHPEQHFLLDPPCSIWELRGYSSPINPESNPNTFSFLFEKDTTIFKWSYDSTKDKDKIPLSEVSMQITITEEETLQISFTYKTKEPLFNELLLPKLDSIDMGTDIHIVVPYWMGEIYDSRIYPEKNTGFTGKNEWEYPGTLSMQWLGIYNSSKFGFCLWTQDIQQSFKSAYIYGNGQKGGLGWKNYLHDNKDKTLHLSYPISMTAIHGDWYEMAYLYRQWARNQFWAQKSRKALHRTAPWVENTALWIWNRTESDKVLLPAIDMSQRLQKPVSVLWHWWHGCAYDIGFPEYLPPREGYTSFSENLEKAKKEGIHALIYVNQRLWGTTTRSWEEQKAERYAVIGKDGKIHPEIYNIFKPVPCAPMCMGTEFWHKTLLNVMLPMWNNTPIAGFYLDQACASLPCFATNHGHAPGEKNFWMKGFQKLTTQIRNQCELRDNNPNNTVVLAGEGCGEAWLPYLDLFLSLQVSKGRYSGGNGWLPAPLFQAVYHPIALQFGNYASLTEPPYDSLWPPEFAPMEPLKILDEQWNTQFRYEQACAFVWGQQPMIANYKKELWDNRKQELDFVLKLATLRHKFPEYFLNGELLKPLPENLSDTWNEIGLSVYAYRKEGGKIFQRHGSLLVTMPWHSINGKTALAVANADDKERLLEFTIPSKDWLLQNEGKIIRHDINNSTIINSFSDGIIHYSQKIDKLDIFLLEFQ